MRKSVLSRLEARFQSFDDLLGAVAPEEWQKTLPHPKSKSLAVHMWCVICARQAYGTSIAAGSWQGFDGGFLQSMEPEAVLAAHSSSVDTVRSAVEAVSDWSEAQDELLADLAEHETMHEGQIIRLLHGLEVDIPASVKWD